MNKTFTEVQVFRQRWLWMLLILAGVSTTAVFGYGTLQQLIYDRPWGDHPMSDKALVLTSIVIISFSAGMIYLFYTLRLITEVRVDGLYIRFYPLRSKTIPYNMIAKCQARTYKPLSEYGGWGIKYGLSGWAYNISGNQGVQLLLKNDQRILVGSQRAEELLIAIKQHCNC